MSAATLNKLAVENAALLRALRDRPTGGWETLTALATHLTRDPSNLRRSLDRLEDAGLAAFNAMVTGLTAEGEAQLAMIDRAEGQGGDEPGSPSAGQGEILFLNHAQIFPDHQNARRDWDSDEARDELDNLRQDIVQNGLLQNLVVRGPDDMGGLVKVVNAAGHPVPLYTLVGGERRWRAIGEAMRDGDWAEDRLIPCRLLDTDDLGHRLAALAENLQRRNLNPIEKAKAFEGLALAGLSNQEIADRVSSTPEHVQQHRRFLQLDEADQQRMTLPRDDQRRLSVRDARAKLAKKADEPAPAPVTPMTRLAWIELTHAAYNEGEHSNLWNSVQVGPDARDSAEGMRLQEIGAVEFSTMHLHGPRAGRFTAKRHYDANRVRIDPPFPAGMFDGDDERNAILRAAQVEALGDQAPEWPENDVAYATPWLADIGELTPEGEATRDAFQAADAEAERIREENRRRWAERQRAYAEARARHIQLLNAARQAPTAGQPEEVVAIAADLDRPFPWQALPSGAIVAANGTEVKQRLYGAAPSDQELALNDMIVVAANAAAGVVTPTPKAPGAEGLSEEAFLNELVGSLRELPEGADLPDDAAETLAATVLSAFLADNGVAFGDEGFDWSAEGAYALAVTHWEDAAEAEESETGEEPASVSEPGEPAVPIDQSVDPDFIVCLEDGRKFKSLKRHLRTRYNLSPEEYRAKWGLADDYPMVAASYAKARQELAEKMGASA